MMIRLRPRTLFVFALLGFMTSPLAVRGGTIVSNLAEPPGAVSPVVVTNDTFWAQQFTSGVPSVLTEIITQLGNFDSGNSGDFALAAALYSTPSAGTLPDGSNLVTTFTFDQNSIPVTGFANVAFSPVGSVGLDPSLYYWFVLTGSSSDDTGGVDWQFTESSSSTGPGSLTGVGRFDTPGPWGLNDSGPFLIEVQGLLPVPEPASWVLGLAGLTVASVGTALSRMRRRTV
jgi:hypothetical protein